MYNFKQALYSWESYFIKLEKKLVDTRQWNNYEYEEFYQDSLHGREHALDVTETSLKWVQQFEFDQIDGFDLEVLVVAGFLHDIKGLGASGSEKRKNHHEEGALCVNIVLNKFGWEESRIKKVMHCIQTHRGLNPNLNFEGFPKNYINHDPKIKPNPQILEAKLIRDADSYQELINPKRFDDMVDEYRPKLNRLFKAQIENHEASKFSYQPDYVEKYNNPGYLKKRADKIDREKNLWKIASQIPISWKESPYANLLLDHNRRGSARFCDRMAYLIGKFLQSADYRLYSVPEIQNFIQQSNAIYFEKYLCILEKRASQENLAFSEILVHIIETLKIMKKAHYHLEWQEVFRRFISIVENYKANLLLAKTDECQNLNEIN